MAINFTAVTIIAPPTGTRRPCNGGVFNLQIRITGNCNAAGGRYAVDIYDEDVLPGGDDKLDTVAGLPLPQGNFNVVENVQLKCDENCHVVGALGSSGESDAEIYAYAREQGVPAAPTLASPTITLHCGDDKGDKDRREPRRETKDRPKKKK